MNKLMALAVVALLCAGCTSKTEFGDCIGAFDDGNPSLNYKLSVKNAILATAFVETIVVPVVVVADQARCPVSKKVVPAAQAK